MVFVGRKKELKFLEEQYRAEENRLIIVYGRKGNGKTELIQSFLKEIDNVYYCAASCSEREQGFAMRREWRQHHHIEVEGLSYEELLSQAMLKNGEKRVIVLDEFYRCLKYSDKFLKALEDLWRSNLGKNNLMLVLCTSSVQWVENEMVQSFGKFAMSISSYLKIKEFTFLDMVNRFPRASVEECITIYAILGGVPAYLNLWSPDLSVEQNVIRLILDKNGPLYQEAENYLKSELRELSFYNSILAAIADDKMKLNLIHEQTGFSRAKISVYIKNMIQIDVLEKVFSFDEFNYENTQKGLYAIRDSFLHFWYKYVFPNITQLELGMAEQVYHDRVAPTIHRFITSYYIQVCKEYLNLMNVYKKLPIVYQSCGSWYGKKGNLDIIAVDDQKKVILGTCKWSNEPMTQTDMEDLYAVMISASVEANYYYFFSKSGFTQGLKESAKKIENMVLMDLDSL